jgi:hypothetical protein
MASRLARELSDEKGLGNENSYSAEAFMDRICRMTGGELVHGIRDVNRRITLLYAGASGLDEETVIYDCAANSFLIGNIDKVFSARRAAFDAQRTYLDALAERFNEKLPNSPGAERGKIAADMLVEAVDAIDASGIFAVILPGEQGAEFWSVQRAADKPYSIMYDPAGGRFITGYADLEAEKKDSLRKDREKTRDSGSRDLKMENEEIFIVITERARRQERETE